MKAKLTRRILATLLAVVMILSLVPSAFAGSFTDVPDNSWFAAAVEYCNANGLMSGTGSGFNPTGKVTREQTVQTLYAKEGKPEVEYAKKFSDVSDGQWYTKAVLWAVDNGITAGVAEGIFGVGRNVTREQVALFLMSYAKLSGMDISKAADLSVFPDAATAHDWAVNALKWAVAEGLLSGKGVNGKTLLAPLDELTRAELAVILANFNEKLPDMTGKTVILHTNDIHGAIEGYAAVKALKTRYEDAGAAVILADAGDFSQGTTYVSISKGQTAVEMMNLAGYDVATLGNHEFDYGAEVMFDNLEAAKFKVLCANVIQDESPIYPSGAVFDMNGVKIGFVGLETPEAQTKTNPALIEGLTFLTDPAIWHQTQATVNDLKTAGADVIVVLSHLGVDDSSEPYRSYDLLEKVEGIDFVIDGHSHTVMTEGANKEPIQSTGTAFKNIGVVVIDNETKAIEDNYLYALSQYSAKDAEVLARAQEIIAEIEALYGEKFATSEVELNGAKAPNGNRDSETNNGDLITDAMVWYLTEKNPGSITEVDAKNIVAITNGGGIRAAIKVGDVTRNDIFTVLPFGNTAAVVYVTGAELLEALEASTYCTPDAVGGFPQVSGMKFTIKTYKEYDANETTYPGSTYYGPKSINRVTIDEINGQKFDPAAKYAVITNNFCAAGGDTYYAFAAATSQFDTGFTLDAIVMDYITEKLEGVITAEQYGEPKGRITIKTEAPSKDFASVVIPDGADMLKYGHIDLDISADKFLEAYEYGDMVTVNIEGYGSYDVPVCGSYDDVAAGEMLLRAVPGKSYLILAINYGQIAVEAGLVELAPEGSATKYVVKEGVTFPINATVSPVKPASFESVVIPDGADMLKYGHLDLDINADEFLAKIPLGSKVTIAIDGYDTFENIPVCASYDDVASGEMLLRAVSGKTYLILAINYGQVAVEQGIVELAPEGSATKYVVKEGVTFPINVTITKEAGTADENIIGNLVRTDVRTDYPELTDAQFANFRKIATTGILDGILYRSSSPINPEIGRNTYADAAAAAAGIKTFINLADTEAEATGYPGYAESYYSAQNHIFLGLPVAFTTKEFKDGLAAGFRYMIANDGPYLVHCTEGKDRAGLTAALLEALMGASYEEILNDYVETYRNYYSVEDGAQRALTPEEVEAIEAVIIANLKLSLGVEINAETDLVAAVEAYMAALGLTEEEIADLKARLGGKPVDYTGKTVILHTNDIHGAIAGYAKVAGLKKDFESKGAKVILADAGDFSQGTTAVSLSKGKNAVDMMNLVGYDVATLGNHEFDYGAETLFDNLEAAEFKVLCANVIKDGTSIYPGGAVFNMNGVKVGFIGLETPEAQTKANPALIQGLTFLTDPAIWSQTQSIVNDLKTAGADVIIVLSHLGVDGSSEPYRAYDLLEKVEGIDFVIDGHSHTVMTEGANKEPIQSTGTALANIGVIVIDNETKAIEDNYLYEVTEDTPTDADVAAAAKEITDAIEAEYGAKFATSEVELNGAKAPNGNRDSETNNGDLITDAMIWCVTEQYPGSIAEVPAENIVAITNGGGIRAAIKPGDVTKNDIFTVLPFGNTVAVVYVTGAELLEALEASTFCTPASVGGFPQIAGMKFDLDLNEDYDANAEPYPNSTYYGPKSINRVTITDVNGKAFDPTATYAVVTNNFCAGGGDTYYAFAAATSQFDTGYTLDTVVMDYITEKLGGTITAAQYGEPQGRINIIEKIYVPWDRVVTIGGTTLNTWFTKYGNTYCDCTTEHFTGTEDNGFGFKEGDIVTVKFLGQEIDLPVGTNYSDVDSGTGMIKLNAGGYIEFAINMGNFGSTYGLVDITKVDGVYTVTAKEGVTFPVNIEFELKEAQGYAEELAMHRLTRTNERADYEHLTDAEFANFRQVTTTGMGDHLYRGSSPINPEIGRNTYADAALAEAGVTVIMNLADNQAAAEAYAGYADTYYSKQNIKFLNLGVDFMTIDFQAGLAEGLKFFAANEGTYYVHCTEGKDRAGFVNALLECLVGATADEVIADYMTTYYNYYGVTTDDARYAPIANSNIIKTLKTAFGVEDLATADLAAEAEEYIKTIGLNDTEIAALKANLGDKTPAADVYEKVTADQTDWSGTYLIVYEMADGSAKVFNGQDATGEYVTLSSISDQKITFEEGMCAVVVEEMEGGYSVKVGEQYMYDKGASSNGTSFGATPKATTFASNEDGTVTMTCNTCIFRFNTNSGSGNDRFRYYKSTSTSFPLICLYKLAEG